MEVPDALTEVSNGSEDTRAGSIPDGDDVGTGHGVKHRADSGDRGRRGRPVRRRGEASTGRTAEAGSLAHGEAGAGVAWEDWERAGECRGMKIEWLFAAQPATAREERGASEASDANHAPAGAQ